MDNNLSAVIMAAGLGTRMKSELPKVLHKLDEKPLIIHALEKALSLKPSSVTIIVGHKADEVIKTVSGWAALNNPGAKIVFARQKLLKGSGRALIEAVPVFKKYKNIFVLSGDAPLTGKKTFSAMLRKFYSSGADCLVLTCVVSDVKNYGRIIRDSSGSLKAIVEASDASAGELEIKEVNSGIYVFKTAPLLKALSSLKPKGPKREYYLTDTLENILKKGGRVEAFRIEDELQITGINSREELAWAYRKLLERKIQDLMASGVTVTDPSNTYISSDVRIGADTVIYPGCFIGSGSVIGGNCKIGPYSLIEKSVIKDGSEIKPFCCVYESEISAGAAIGPFSHLRPLSVIGPGAKVGNFSEIKKSRIGAGSKVPHLSYIGDTLMGEKVNVGAGSITCNYDGVKKNTTVIGDRAFIGSNTNLVAPVKVGKGALIGAGSTITENIPDEKLALARARQVIKEKRKI